jgi:hypothetical protein
VIFWAPTPCSFVGENRRFGGTCYPYHQGLLEGGGVTIAIAKISLLMLFRYIMGIYFENHTKPTNKARGKNTEILKVVHTGVVLYRAKKLVYLVFCEEFYV